MFGFVGFQTSLAIALRHRTSRNPPVTMSACVHPARFPALMQPHCPPPPTPKAARKGTASSILDHTLYRGPFSAGARRCPGSRVAGLEAHALLLALVSDWSIEPEDKDITWRQVCTVGRREARFVDAACYGDRSRAPHSLAPSLARLSPVPTPRSARCRRAPQTQTP